MSDDERPKWVDLFGIDPDWPVAAHERENHALRRILTDLIAELRVDSSYHQHDNPEAANDFARAADRAEARLREVGGDD